MFSTIDTIVLRICVPVTGISDSAVHRRRWCVWWWASLTIPAMYMIHLLINHLICLTLQHNQVVHRLLLQTYHLQMKLCKPREEYLVISGIKFWVLKFPVTCYTTALLHQCWIRFSHRRGFFESRVDLLLLAFRTHIMNRCSTRTSPQKTLSEMSTCYNSITSETVSS